MSTKLGCICKFQSGGTPSKSNQDYYNGGIPWVTTTSLNGKQIDARDAVDWITEKAIDETAAKIVPANSIMVGTRVGVGKVAVNLVDMSTSQDIISLLDIDDSAWDKDFLCKYIQGKNRFLKSQARGATIKGIKIDVLANLDLPEISIDKQRYISTNLDKVNHVIELRKKELEEFDELIRARFVELFGSISNNKFGYEVMTLQDVCEPIKDGTHQTPTYTEDAVNGYKFLSSKDVTSGKVDWNHLKYIPEGLHKELYKRISPRKGDILLAKNGTTGVAAIVDRDDVFDIYVSLALLRPLGMVTSEYLCSAVNSIETKHQFDSSLKGIGVPNLHLGEIKKTKIVVPPIEEQEKFAEFVKQVDKSKVVALKAA